MGRIGDLLFVAIVGWLYATVLRGPRRKVKPVGHRIPRARRSSLRRNRYVLPGDS